MKKIYSIFTSAIVLLVALQGCNKTYLKEVVDESKKQNQEVPVIEDDEITKVLRGIKGVSNVTISLAALPAWLPFLKPRQKRRMCMPDM